MISTKDDKWTWWDDLKLNIETSFPVKHIVDLKNYIRHRLTTNHHLIKTKLPKGRWYDTDTRMLYGMMNLLMQYIEEEKPFEIIDWDNDEWHRNARDEMIAIRDWQLNYDNRCKEIDQALTEWSDAKFGKDDNSDMLERLNEKNTPETEALFERHSQLEDKLLKEEEMLIRLVKIRNYLWT